eukprot:m.58812 g.58812  ORF g.58812 m.58812 type:complete len:199 (-) comp12206_c0_seq1:37-633(-)
MFVLSVARDVVRIAPHRFSAPRANVIAAAINEKYANKVVYNVGLCIALFDVLSTGDEYIHPGDGGATLHVEFRLIVFHPFVGEVLTGTIRSSSPQGIHVSMGFFDDIIIPPEHMKRDTRFDAKDSVWFWQTGESEAFLDLQQEIRFRVVEDLFVDITPHEAPPSTVAVAAEEETRKRSPYTIVGSIDDDGLGLTIWWQ